jgi:hypothetical protein
LRTPLYPVIFGCPKGVSYFRAQVLFPESKNRKIRKNEKSEKSKKSHFLSIKGRWKSKGPKNPKIQKIQKSKNAHFSHFLFFGILDITGNVYFRGPGDRGSVQDGGRGR